MKYPRIVEGLLAKHAGEKGYGIFALRAYKKEELIVRAQGVHIHHTDKRLTHRGIQVSKHHFIEPKRFGAIWYLNHSCSPNAYIDHDACKARRAIQKGEEITTDYSLFTDYSSWDMHCACGSKTCRKLILPYRCLRNSPASFVSGYLRKTK